MFCLKKNPIFVSRCQRIWNRNVIGNVKWQKEKMRWNSFIHDKFFENANYKNSVFKMKCLFVALLLRYFKYKNHSPWIKCLVFIKLMRIQYLSQYYLVRWIDGRWLHIFHNLSFNIKRKNHGQNVESFIASILNEF